MMMTFSNESIRSLKICNPSLTTPPSSTTHPTLRPRKSLNDMATLVARPLTTPSSQKQMPIRQVLAPKKAMVSHPTPKLLHQSSPMLTPIPIRPRHGQKSHQFGMCKVRPKGRQHTRPQVRTRRHNNTTILPIRLAHITEEAAVARAKRAPGLAADTPTSIQAGASTVRQVRWALQAETEDYVMGNGQVFLISSPRPDAEHFAFYHSFFIHPCHTYILEPASSGIFPIRRALIHLLERLLIPFFLLCV